MANNTKSKPRAKSAPKKLTKAAEIQREKERALKQDDINRIVGVVLFVLAILGFFVACISGDGAWNTVHIFYVGVFGYFAAILFPIITIIVTVLHSLKSPSVSKMIIKSVEGIILVLLFSTIIHVIITKADSVMTYSQMLKYCYMNAVHSFNGGWIGALIGGLLLTCGKAPAIIISLVLIFFDFMMLTGFTLIQFFKGVSAPAKKAAEQISPIIEEKREERKKNRFDIDVALDDEPKPNNKKSEASEQTSVPKNIIDEINEATAKNKKEREGLGSINVKEKSIDEIVKKASAEPEEKKIENLVVPKKAMETSVADYRFPSINILKESKNVDTKDVSGELKSNAEKLITTLHSFNVDAVITDICRGPTVTRYELKPAAGIRISKITNLADDIALNLAATHVRIEAPIPGKAAVGIEVPNTVKNSVSMHEIIDTSEFANAKSKLTAGLGKDIAGKCVYADMAKMPHLLIAGTTGSGKSVCMNSIIVSMLYKAKPDEVKFLMIDPKQVEFSKYAGIPHLLVPVVTDPRKAAGALGWAVSEMLQRYQKFSETGVRDIEGYNKFVLKHDELAPMPKIVIFIDELSDLMMAAPKEVEDSICRLAQMARAAGMHLIIATQRPSVDVITGLIKANISSRIALTVSSQIDSRTILDTAGAEKLLGRGDMLFNPVGASKPLRVQGCFISDEEVEDLCNFIKDQGESNYSDEIQKEIEAKAVQDKKSSPFEGDDSGENLDEHFNDAVDVVLELGKASTSLLQRKLGVGYARGAKIMDQLEDKGIIGPSEGAKPRKILVNRQQWLEMQAYSGDRADFTADNTEQISFDNNEDDGEEF